MTFDLSNSEGLATAMISQQQVGKSNCHALDMEFSCHCIGNCILIKMPWNRSITVQCLSMVKDYFVTLRHCTTPRDS